MCKKCVTLLFENDNYMNISAFMIGVATAFFAIFSLHILFWRKGRTRFQMVMGCIMAVWAVWSAKDLIVTFPGMYTPEVLNWIQIVDGWSALSYTVFVFEVVMPGWTTWRRMLLLALPFVAFTLGYVFGGGGTLIRAYSLFLWFYAWAIVIVAYVRMTRYLDYVRKNFSNIDNIDVSWLRPVFFFAIAGQLAWLFTSLYASVLVDILYYVLIIMLWLVVLHYSWNFRPIVVEKDAEVDDAVPVQKNVSPIPEGALERLVEEQRLYLKKDLTLSELAQALNTNRTYVSNYLSQVRQQTFYDYINQLRIERESIPMMQEHPEYKLEHVAKESGFASMSTFRRAFTKLTGQMPSQFASSSSS